MREFQKFGNEHEHQATTNNELLEATNNDRTVVKNSIIRKKRLNCESIIAQYKSFNDMTSTVKFENYGSELRRHISTYPQLCDLFDGVIVCNDDDDVDALNRFIDHVKIYLIIAKDRSFAYSGKGNILSRRLSEHRFHKNPELRQIIRTKHIFRMENICNVFLREYARHYCPTMRVVNENYHHCENFFL